MDSIIKELMESQEEIKNGINKVNITLVRHEETLKQHIYRTELAERRLDCIEDQIEPIKGKMSQIDGILKLIGGIAIILSIVAAFFQILRP